jgi:hypothetical protein
MYFVGVNAGEVNETETRELITDSLKKAGWQLHKNMRYEYKITDGRVHINEDDEAVEDDRQPWSSAEPEPTVYVIIMHQDTSDSGDKNHCNYSDSKYRW